MKPVSVMHMYLSEGALADDLEGDEVVDAEPRPLEPQELCLLGGVRHALLVLLRLRDARLGDQRLLEALQSGKEDWKTCQLC